MNPRLPECKPRVSKIDWELFRSWLRKDHARDNADELFRQAKRYHYVLMDSGRAVGLASLSKDSRRMAMVSLSNLAKFLGVYDYWRSIVRNNGLKWEGKSTLEVIVDILNTDIGEVKTWLKESIGELPKEHGTVLVFAALTGMRPTEAALSCKLISELSEEDRLENYLNRELYVLEHFRFKNQFLRKCKNAYVSFITPELLDLVETYKPKIDYEAVDSALGRRGFPTGTKDLRKLYATLLRDYLPKELIDLVQGRVSQSVFLRFYYKPLLSDIREKVLKATTPLQNELLPLMKPT